ncbi:hypothetical protein [Nocardioides sp. GY 10127]|uniref:hypothetical protein n=1 Tax=Nocardioides sp. GY 10127 TaxID=2569762 RepID=UPI0010A8785D|nr:hypothetical protein [Nocardioides sp. GY 10127]TIC82589.1 hypothetical protein E8D37_07680 [Nocardioides sp. GY 10127]
MSIDLAAFEPAVHRFADAWATCGAVWTVKPIDPNHGKALTLAEFDSDSWLASVILWETGELDLDAGRKVDGWLVAKHFDLKTPDELDGVLDELLSLLRDGAVPSQAFTSWI